jgi:hypothetical protein
MSQTAEEKRLAKYRRYNASEKGQKRHQRYEQTHPDRSKNWSVEMLLRKNGKS